MRTARLTGTTLLALATTVLLSACTGDNTGPVSTRSTASSERPATSTPAPSTPAPATAAVPTSTAPTSTAPAPSPAAPTSMVTAWARQAFKGLSFVVPAQRAHIDEEDYNVPDGYALYNWNNPMQAGIPPISVGVFATDVWPEGVHGGQDPTSTMRPITVRGCTSAYLQANPFPVIDGAQPLTDTDVFCKTSTTFYSVKVITPSTADGDALAQTMVNSLKVLPRSPLD